jgi:hypothetical protein
MQEKLQPPLKKVHNELTFGWGQGHMVGDRDSPRVPVPYHVSLSLTFLLKIYPDRILVYIKYFESDLFKLFQGINRPEAMIAGMKLDAFSCRSQ